MRGGLIGGLTGKIKTQETYYVKLNVSEHNFLKVVNEAAVTIEQCLPHLRINRSIKSNLIGTNYTRHSK